MRPDGGSSAEIGGSTQDDAASRIWRYWKLPVLFGAGLCALQLALFLVRFGYGGGEMPPGQWAAAILNLSTGLLLFFGGGLLAGLLVQRVLRGSFGKWRVFLLVATAVATPIAVMMSLAGGLLGPPFVVAYAAVPYILLVGIPVLARKIWRRLCGAEGAGCACG